MIPVSTCAIPVTRWKQGVRGIKPVVAPMSKLISSERKPDNSKIGRTESGFRSERPAMPTGKITGNLLAWEVYLLDSLKAKDGIVPLQIRTVTE